MNEGIVIFDPAEFTSMCPEWRELSDAALGNYFKTACLILNNTKKSIVKDLDERKTLLFLLVCHIAELSKRGGGTVGALSSASQGKVSASFGLPTNQTWYNQTQCGYLFWQAMAKYRAGGKYIAYERSPCLK